MNDLNYYYLQIKMITRKYIIACKLLVLDQNSMQTIIFFIIIINDNNNYYLKLYQCLQISIRLEYLEPHKCKLFVLIVSWSYDNLQVVMLLLDSKLLGTKKIDFSIK